MRRTLQRNMPALLELFKGTGSIGRAFEARGWEVVSLDILPKFTHHLLRPSALGLPRRLPARRFDFVWASPVCTEHSQALTTRPRRLHERDALVLRPIEIIAYLATLGHREPADGAAQDKALYAAPRICRRHILLVRYTL